jgi:thiopeptide-type bacteriocin biosynthesis protein
METINKNTDNIDNINGNQSQPQPLKRTFIVGDEWLYYKFYTGPKTADVILTEMIKPVTGELLSHQLIDYWFFIRYADPQLHTRVRFHLGDPQNIAPVIQAIRSYSTPYIEKNLVWKIQLDTYQREVERYGINSMDLSEKWFFYDSKMIVDMLSLIEGDEGERIRWLFALRAVDTMLDDFRFDLEPKFDLVTMLRENFGREHGMNHNLKEQMEQKFRKDRAVINELMDRNNDLVSEMLPLFQFLAQKSAAVQPIAEQILALNKSNRLGMPLNDLMGSYSHMMVNRLFKSKQRTHEMVLYDFLHRYYKSEIARKKYSQINIQKKKKKDKE